MSPDDWTALALDVLAQDGPEAVTVATLCQRAGRTRGSLYHHFPDHHTLLAETLEAWVRSCTDALIQATPPEPGAAARLHALAAAIDPRLEQGVRRLVERTPALRTHVQAIDARRIAHLTQLNEQDGDPPPEARARAEVEYAAFLGFQQLRIAQDRQETLYRWFSHRRGDGGKARSPASASNAS